MFMIGARTAVVQKKTLLNYMDMRLWPACLTRAVARISVINSVRFGTQVFPYYCSWPSGGDCFVIIC